MGDRRLFWVCTILKFVRSPLRSPAKLSAPMHSTEGGFRVLCCRLVRAPLVRPSLSVQLVRPNGCSSLSTCLSRRHTVVEGVSHEVIFSRGDNRFVSIPLFSPSPGVYSLRKYRCPRDIVSPQPPVWRPNFARPPFHLPPDPETRGRALAWERLRCHVERRFP